MHDKSRGAIEVKFAREDFKRLEKIFLLFGFAVKIKGLRLRNIFEWQEISVMLDLASFY